MNLNIKSLLLGTVMCLTGSVLFAGEGMWLPLLLKALNESEMQDLGMKLTAEDIYSVNKGSLKDAIVHFNGGCTSELISPQGLLLTNHHCGYSQIQNHSTLEKNYLRNGFWAANRQEELSNPGVTATLIVRIEDVSDQVLQGVGDQLSPKDRQSAIDKNLEKVKAAAKIEPYEEVVIRPFYKGNQYYLFVTVTYRDIRLVGAPPESVGKFGSDTDNWVWPRHTGDFALFRIYAGKDNLPADYSEDNVPFKPKHFLPISLDGVEEGDFSMVFGFPGRTDQYLPSYAVQQIVDVLNPAKIAVRDRALKIVDAEMRADESIRLQYASKFARIANYWKKWIGENLGLKSTNGIGKKQQYEKEFTSAIGKNANFRNYTDLLPRFEELYRKIEPYALTRDYHNEIMGRNVELMQVAGYMARLKELHSEQGENAYEGFKKRLLPFLKGFYKNYRPEIDKKVFAALMDIYEKEVPIKELAGLIAAERTAQKVSDNEGLAQKLYQSTMLTNWQSIEKLLTTAGQSERAAWFFTNDPLVAFASKLREAYAKHVSPPLEDYTGQINETQRRYMKAQMEVFPDKRFYPDANRTMRVTYGQVKGYQPRDAVNYGHQTYLSGVMEKYQPGDYEFDVPEKLIELYERKDYGAYGENGKMPVCFIGSNHTTGGNSGSPAIDAHGNLVGLNFDRVWEGTMSDINYDSSICRNIMVDARYILFIIDKYAGARHLIMEMTLVHPKRK